MIPTTRFIDYSMTDNIRMAEKAAEFFPIFEEASQKLVKAKETKLKVVKDDTRSNDIYINPSIRVEFAKLLDSKMPVHLIIDKYEEWFEELYRLTVVNEPWLTHKAVFQHMAEVMTICATFEDILNYAKEGLPMPPKES